MPALLAFVSRLASHSVLGFPDFGVVRVLYDSASLAAIAKEAAKPDSILSLEDRMGLILDAPALAKAGLLKTSDVFTLLDAFRNEKECKWHCSTYLQPLYILNLILQHLFGLLSQTLWEIYRQFGESMTRFESESKNLVRYGFPPSVWILLLWKFNILLDCSTGTVRSSGQATWV